MVFQVHSVKAQGLDASSGSRNGIGGKITVLLGLICVIYV
jgi:hypothetical protein